MRTFVFTLILLTVSSSAYAQSVTARMDPGIIENGSIVRYYLEVTVEGRVPIQVTKLPDFKGFSVLDTRSSPQSLRVNNFVQTMLNVVVTLRAEKEGKFTFEPPEVSIARARHKGTKATVTVVPTGKLPKIKKPLTKTSRYAIEAEVLPRLTPFVGEQISLNYVLIADGRGIDMNPSPPDEPNLDEFWIEGMHESFTGRSKTEKRNGRIVSTRPMRNYALFPLQSGPITIEPMESDVMVGSMLRPQPIRIGSKPVQLNVRSLPPNPPKGFYEGNVGEWTVSSVLSESKTRVGSTVNLTFSATGNGDVGRFRLPKLETNELFQFVKTNEETSKRTSNKRIIGTRIVTYSVLPLKEGRNELPSIEVPYFNPVTEKYEIASSNKLKLDVGPGTLPEVAVTPKSEKPPLESLEFDLTEQLLSELQEPGSDDGSTSASSWELPTFVVWGALSPLFLFLLVMPFIGRIKRWTAARNDPVVKERKALFEQLQSIDTNSGDAMHDAAALSKRILSMRFEKPAASFSDTRIRSLDHDLDAVAALIKTDESLRFSPDASIRIEQKELTRVIAQLSQLFAALFAFLIVSSAFGTASAEPEIAKTDVHTETIKTLKSKLKVDPQSVHLWTTLGTQAAKARDFATARHALETALFIDPGNDVASVNLDLVAQAVRIASIEASRKGVTIEGDEQLFWWRTFRFFPTNFFGILFVLSGWGFAICMWRRRRSDDESKRDAFAVAAVAALLAFVLCGVGFICKRHVFNDVRPAVIVSKSIELRDGPNEKASRMRTPVALIPGVVVRYVERRDDWIKFALPDDAYAWTRSKHIRVIGSAAK